MSDENQPNEVVESRLAPEIMPAEEDGTNSPQAESSAGDSKAALGVDGESETSTSESHAPVASPPKASASAAEEGVSAGAEDVSAGAEGAPPDVEEVSPEATPMENPQTEVSGVSVGAEIPAAAGVSGGDVLAVESPPDDDGTGEAVATETVTSPSVVSIADIEESKKAPRGTGRVGEVMGNLGALVEGRGWIVVAAVAVLLLVFLFLPPISLAQRISAGGGYTALDSETPSLAHPDGLEVARASDAAERLRLKLDSIPRAEFVAGDVPEELASAVGSVPSYLVPKSPFYTIDLKSPEDASGTMTVVIPNEAEPWDTLDLYTWDGEAWEWLPTKLDRGREVLVSDVDMLPESVIVMQSQKSDQRVAAEVEQWPAENAGVTLHEVDFSGMLIGTMGGTAGNASELPLADEGGQAELVPIVRNWIPEREPNWALVSDMLAMDADRQAHVSNLVGLAQSGGYPGLVVDYRSVQIEDRERYAAFVGDLAEAFQDADLWLAVTVDTPQPSADVEWDTGGYDWAALGAAVDQLRITMPIDPSAYAPGGQAEQLIKWAVAHVDRHKLMPVYSTLSTDGEELVAFEKVLSSVGQLDVTPTVTESVTPGSTLTFTLGDVASVETDPETEATQIATDDAVYWLGTPQWLRTRMDLAARYRLGGVVLRDLFHSGNLAGLLPSVDTYIAAGFGQAEGGAGTYAMPEVVWQVTGPTGDRSEAESQLTQPRFAWTAPTVTGTYRIAAAVSGVDKGAMEILVSEPAPVVTDTLSEDEGETEVTSVDPDEDDSDAESAEDAALKAGFVSDVTVPDNTRFEKGEAFTKTWRMRNAGDADWPEDTVFVFSSGAELAESTEIEVGAVESGEDVDISVDMVAPDEDGTYKSFWALKVDEKTIEGGDVYVQIVVGEPPAEAPPADPETPAAAPQPVAPVSAGSFELGGHIRDAGLPYKDKMHYAGMNWAKVQVHYGEDAGWLINVAHANGFKIQLSAIGGADMVTEPGFEDKFAAWVAGLAAAGADAIEVWNEPNIDREWKIGHISAASYTNLLCKSYSAIKGANAGTAVISAAPAPTGYFGGCSPNGCDDQPWLEGLYNAGAANCMDFIGAHHNSGATSPSARSGHPANPASTHHSWFFLPQTELYYNIFRGTRQLFYTEMGYASQEGVPTFSNDFAWGRGTNNAQQAAWLAEAVQLSINTGMVRCIIVWNIDFVRYGYDPQDGYAIIRPGGSCPACDSLHTVLGTR
ncbi:MAG: NBR1-Ig-like domain-containing protein [Anaerolineae bacterium]